MPSLSQRLAEDRKRAKEQVQGAVDLLGDDDEAVLALLEPMMDNYPEGHPISNAAYEIAERRNLI